MRVEPFQGDQLLDVAYGLLVAEFGVRPVDGAAYLGAPEGGQEGHEDPLVEILAGDFLAEAHPCPAGEFDASLGLLSLHVVGA
ncbi:hypothetical protein [Streptomyces fructofermentans]|uniref:hypothetical protein n=1 Tax=Streptomyces fructofermentans TaxID=152141 RepID=UPI003794F124